MAPSLPPMTEALSADDVVVVKAGTSTVKMSCRIIENPNYIASRWWKRGIPAEMTRVEAEYYALIKGLRMAIEMDYRKAIVWTHYEPLTGKLRDEYTPPEELKHYHESTRQLIERFDEIDVNPKPWER